MVHFATDPPPRPPLFLLAAPLAILASECSLFSGKTTAELRLFSELTAMHRSRPFPCSRPDANLGPPPLALAAATAFGVGVRGGAVPRIIRPTRTPRWRKGDSNHRSPD